MDYHFVHATEKSPKNFNRKKIDFLKNFLPLFALAAFLPFLMFFALNPRTLQFSSRASSKIVRVWLTPTTVQTSVNQQASFTLQAMSEDENVLVPNMSIELPKISQLTFKNPIMSSNQPFSGRTDLGTVVITPKTAGTYEILIDAGSITTGRDDLQIITSPATLVVTN